MNDNDRYRLVYQVTSDIDLSSATVAVSVDGVEYTTTWTTTPTLSGTQWTGRATTSDYFAGSAHLTPAGATVLANGVHKVEIRVTNSGTTKTTVAPDIWVA